jgi:hypothetical protein
MVGQTIDSRGLLDRAFGPRNFTKNPGWQAVPPAYFAPVMFRVGGKRGPSDRRRKPIVRPTSEPFQPWYSTTSTVISSPCGAPWVNWATPC